MTTIAPSPHGISRRKRRFVREIPSPFQLTERDITMVRLVARHRFLRSTHISELCQAPHKKVCARLTSLFHDGYLDRPRAQFDHYREGGGSSPIVYALGNRGAQLLIERDGPEIADVIGRARTISPAASSSSTPWRSRMSGSPCTGLFGSARASNSWNPSSCSRRHRQKRNGAIAHGRGAQKSTTTTPPLNSASLQITRSPSSTPMDDFARSWSSVIAGPCRSIDRT